MAHSIWKKKKNDMHMASSVICLAAAGYMFSEIAIIETTELRLNKIVAFIKYEIGIA